MLKAKRYLFFICLVTVFSGYSYQFICPENNCNVVTNYIGYSTDTFIYREEETKTRKRFIKRLMKEVNDKKLDLETCMA